MNASSVEDVYVGHLGELRSSEAQLVDALAAMADAATDKKLKQAFTEHQTQTEKQLERLEEVIGTAPVDVPTHEGEAMQALIDEGRKIIEADSPGDVKDVQLVAAAQRIEHFEITTYGTARALADQLDLREARDLLGETLDEETAADELLTKLATGGLIVAGLYEKAHGD
jgi:ferritin-like metal-binding protein YciE